MSKEDVRASRLARSLDVGMDQADLRERGEASCTANLKGLAVYTLNLAHTNARKSLTLANSLAKTTTNPQLKQRYSSCAKSYDEAVGNIENALKDLALGDFNGVNIVTSSAMTEIDDCQDKFMQPPKGYVVAFEE
ncbi:pectinesterase inhibitor-like [Cucumis melo]|uniref:Pectinesterase inhibitor-like n=1 Tax=Cucumis melo TaxID=3656 RepID=A0ABM3KUQ3_CUCME|nr:pectinesterase inhibitor-like [Cucumis melo]